jgi:hypothetical protein
MALRREMRRWFACDRRSIELHADRRNPRASSMNAFDTGTLGQGIMDDLLRAAESTNNG